MQCGYATKATKHCTSKTLDIRSQSNVTTHVLDVCLQCVTAYHQDHPAGGSTAGLKRFDVNIWSWWWLLWVYNLPPVECQREHTRFNWRVVLQRNTAVTVHFSSKQLLLFASSLRLLSSLFFPPILKLELRRNFQLQNGWTYVLFCKSWIIKKL